MFDGERVPSKHMNSFGTFSSYSCSSTSDPDGGAKSPAIAYFPEAGPIVG